MLHVTQLDRIVDVVEETSKGRVVTLLVAWRKVSVECMPFLVVSGAGPEGLKHVRHFRQFAD